MNKFSPSGYMGGVPKISRGPWFKEYKVEDDGLDWFYSFRDYEGNTSYLLSNNMELKDRQAFDSLYWTMDRNKKVFGFLGAWISFEVVAKMGYFKGMAPGWKFLSWGAIALFFQNGFMAYSSAYYKPLFSAYMRKYEKAIKNDVNAIEDDKKKYFYIDTSQYMSYTNKDLSDEYHINHGPQPDDEALDSSYLVEVDKFLRGEENHLKSHPKFYDYNFEFMDKSYPSAEKVSDLMHKQQ